MTDPIGTGSLRHPLGRRRFMVAVAGGLLAAPLAAVAQPAGKVYRVATVSWANELSDGPEGPFLSTLRDLGYVEGSNLLVERRSCESKNERAPAVMAEVVSLKVDVIVTAVNSVARAAKEATTSIPIVLAGISGPVEYGLAASLARPGGNVTGLSDDTGPDLHAKRLSLLKEIAPYISRVAFVGTKGLLELVGAKAVEAAARTLGLTLIRAESTATDLAPAFAVVTRERADAIFAGWNPTNFFHRRDIIEFAAKNRLPASYAFRSSAVDGGLMSYGVDRRDLSRRAAGYVDRILRGAKPQDLPIQEPTKLELLINMRTAKVLGLTVPPSLLQGADELIQ